MKDLPDLLDSTSQRASANSQSAAADSAAAFRALALSSSISILDPLELDAEAML